MRETMGRKRRAVLGVSLAAAVVVSAVSPALADTKYESKITLANSFPAFHGKVKSDGGGICVENRKVRLFSEEPGSDELLGKTRTNAKGKWKILREPTSGVFYAKLNKGGSASLMIKCQRAVSKAVVID